MITVQMHPAVPLLQLIRILRRVEGRKKLQKTVHILKELGYFFPERFEYSHYGMYSQQLRREISTFEIDGLLCETTQNIGNNGSQFVIEATDKLDELLAKLQLSEDFPWADTAQRLNSLSAQELEGVSTILFLRHHERTESDVRDELLRLQPHLSGKVDQCFALVKDLSE